MTREYLNIEPFLTDALQARALQAAFELDIIDALESEHEICVNKLLQGRNCDEDGGRFLLQMLTRANVAAVDSDRVRLTTDFRSALAFRDILTTKLTFATRISADYFSSMPELLKSEGDFMTSSKLFEYFDYGRCQDVSTANCMHASRWMQLTTMLTRYEAPVCDELYDFCSHSRMLDVGGNSGEFAVQICRRNPELSAKVIDLPVVCHLGARHAASMPESQRIEFCPGNMLKDPFPENCDLITWKSVLHDWPDEVVRSMLQKSFDALPGGGRMLIFERQRWDFSSEATTYGLLPVMLFFRSYRSPEQYAEALSNCGFADIRVQQIQLEVPFLLISATKAH